MAQPPSSLLLTVYHKLQRRSQRAQQIRQQLRKQRQNDELASARLQQDSQERKIILARDVAITEEGLESDRLCRAW